VRRQDFQIYASDINPFNIEVLKGGFFPAHSFRRDGTNFHPYLEGIGAYKYANGHKREGWLLAADLHRKIKVLLINLYKSDLVDIPDGLDLILLRNILIYMAPATKFMLIDKVTKKLAPGGYLLLSSGEVPLVMHPELELLEWDKVYVYKKKVPGAAFCPERPVAAAGSLPIIASAAAGDNAGKQELDVGLICRCSSLLLKHKLEAVENARLLAVVSQVLMLVNLIHAGRMQEAEAELRRLTLFMQPNELTYYFRAYLDIMYHNEPSALVHLREALGYNEAFWVARFYLAKLLLQAYPRQARREILHCLQDIVTYLEQEDYAYEFLLEGFHAKYFSAICEKWLYKLEQEGLTDEFKS
jgi:hypothetical protein